MALLQLFAWSRRSFPVGHDLVTQPLTFIPASTGMGSMQGLRTARNFLIKLLIVCRLIALDCMPCVQGQGGHWPVVPSQAIRTGGGGGGGEGFQDGRCCFASCLKLRQIVPLTLLILAISTWHPYLHLSSAFPLWSWPLYWQGQDHVYWLPQQRKTRKSEAEWHFPLRTGHTVYF